MPVPYKEEIKPPTLTRGHAPGSGSQRRQGLPHTLKVGKFTSPIIREFYVAGNTCLGLIGVDKGRIEILGEEITGLSGKDLQAVRGRVGFVFQRHNLVPRLSALSNVVHGAQAWTRGPRLWHQALAPKAIRLEAMHCLDLVGLADIAMRRVDRLSGGQSQRVAIARALMQRPQMMLADEPVASLDPNAGEEVMSLFVDLMRREGLTLFYSSHNLDHALAYSDRVIGIRGGVIALDAESHTLRAEGLRQIYE